MDNKIEIDEVIEIKHSEIKEVYGGGCSLQYVWVEPKLVCTGPRLMGPTFTF